MKSGINKLNISQSATTVKTAAIWARVSSQGQAETSLPSQISRVKEVLEAEGFTVVHTLQTEWTSLDLFSCPQFQILRSLIQHKEIDAVGVYDRDRLQAKGLQRLLFLSDCKEVGVRLLLCQGPPIVDEPEGQIVELALALGKERSVLRAQQGARDGLHDRATKRHLPVSYHKLYGYQWDKPNRLVPDSNYTTVKLIFDLLLEGSSYTPIIRELERRGIASPAGNTEWNRAALSNIAHNPTYTGRYFALKKLAAEPKARKGNTYGNSSRKLIPLDEAYYLPEIEVVNPVVTWEQQGRIFDQLKRHQKLSQRNARSDYLLRGLVVCETHTGKKGDPRHYHGKQRSKSWEYDCPVGGCVLPCLNGPKLEDWLKGFIAAAFFGDEDSLETELLARNKGIEASLHKELAACEKHRERAINLLAQLEDRFLSGVVDDEVYQRLRAKYNLERNGNESRRDELLDQLALLDREADATASLEDIQERFLHRVTEFDQGEWRNLLAMLNLEIRVAPVDVSEAELKAWGLVTTKDGVRGGKMIVFPTGHPFGRGFIKLSFGVPIRRADYLEGFVSTRGSMAQHKTHIYPLRFSFGDFATEPASVAKGVQ